MIVKKVAAKLFFAAFFLIVFESAHSQFQTRADSLKQVLLSSESMPDSLQLSTLYEIVLASSSPQDKLIFANQLLDLALTNKQVEYIIKAHLSKGPAYRLIGDLKKSLEHLFISAKMANQNGFYNLQAQAYGEIANSYISNKDYRKSLVYQLKAIDILRAHSYTDQLSINLLNTGYNYYSLGELDSALLLYMEAEPIFDETKLLIGKAYTIGNRALVYWKKGDLQTAERDLLKAIELLEPLGDQFGMADFHNQLGSVYLDLNNYTEAIEHTQIALEMAHSLDLKEQMRDASKLLSKLYTLKEEYKTALEYQTQYIAFKDSIENTDQTKKMADIRTEYEVSLKEKEIDILEKRQRLVKTYIVIAIILLAFSIVLVLYFRQRFRTARLINIAQKKQHNEKINDMLNQEQNKALQAMVQGRDIERKRLAQELHNHFGSLLATVKVNLNGMDDVTSPKYQTITTLVDQACTDIRNISHSLNMGIAEDFGLIPALKELIAHLEQSGKLKVEFTPSMGDYKLDSEHEILIYRIVQELISNVLKHAKATKLSVMLTYFMQDNLVNILVHDNGVGFNKKTIQRKSNGMGLNSLKKMVLSLQGDIQFDSNPAGGTTVNIDLPISNTTHLNEL
ncbi:MAG: tetratricopeptide repeat protein [Prolixibacteraceae bacterium]